MKTGAKLEAKLEVRLLFLRSAFLVDLSRNCYAVVA